MLVLLTANAATKDTRKRVRWSLSWSNGGRGEDVVRDGCDDDDDDDCDVGSVGGDDGVGMNNMSSSPASTSLQES